MKKVLLAAAMGCALPLSAQADFLGFVVGGYQWQQNYEGNINTEGTGLEVDLENDLGFDKEDGLSYYVAFEHPVPFLPNIMVSHTELEVEESSTLNREITFDGVTYAVDTDVDSTGDLSHNDITLYYELVDILWVDFDLGITGRVFDGGFDIRSATESANEDLDGVVPMAYGALKVEVPTTGLYAGVKANFLSVGDFTFVDYLASVGWESDLGLGIEAGLRSMDMDFEDDEDEADLTVDGGYIGVFYHF